MKFLLYILIGSFYLLIHGCAAPHAQDGSKGRILVLAHYMACCPYYGPSSTKEDYRREIRLARRYGVDGFAINTGRWDPDRIRQIDTIYSAAEEESSNFKIMISLDGDAKDHYIEAIERYKHSPNQLRIDDKIAISSFNDDRSISELAAITDEIRRFDGKYIPHFFIDNISSPALAGRFGKLDGYFNFNASGSEFQKRRSTLLAESASNNFQKFTFIEGISAFYRGNGSNFRVFDCGGFTCLLSGWNLVRRDGKSIVELVTWNDWAESTYFSPSPEFDWRRTFGPHLPDHSGFLTLSRHIANTLRGRESEIDQNCLVYSYVPHPKSVPITVNAGHAPPEGNPVAATASRDYLYFIKIGKPGADLSIHIENGANSFIWRPQSDLETFSTPLVPGNIRITETRTGVSAVSTNLPAGFSAANSDYRYNYIASSIGNDCLR